jgi:hypothetical protein
MNRKHFLKIFTQTCVGVGCCGAAFAQAMLSAGGLSSQSDQQWIDNLESRLVAATETPGWEKARKAEIWIKDIVKNMDDILDDKTKVKLMQANGQCCYSHAFGVADERTVSPEMAEQVLKYLENKGHKLERGEDTTTLHFSWGKDHQNPWGLILGDGYCMCPNVEKVKGDISPTYCLCSTGYIREMFKRLLGKPVEVSLVESVVLGADDCRFKVVINEK